MLVVTITMTALPPKQQELLLTLHELIAVMRRDQGFVDARVCLRDADSPVLTLVEKWATPEAAQAYMQSEYFRVLRGALQLLTSSSEIMLQNEDTTRDTRWTAESEIKNGWVPIPG